jgi:periplasmic copper chaperone A
MRSVPGIAPRVAGVGLVLAALIVTGCTAATPKLTVSGAWVRSVAAAGQPTAAYLVISNGSGQPDTLVSASSPDAATVELHETTTDSSGMTGMQHIDKLAIPAEGEVALQPGGHHLMIMGLSRPLTAGGRLELDLVFEKAGKVAVMAEVRDG